MMTTTIDVPDDVMKRTMQAAGADSAHEAVMKALEEFVGRHDQRSLIPLLGTFESLMTVEELDELRRMD